MPRVSTDQLAARRQQILDGARACFTRYGYEGATVRRRWGGSATGAEASSFTSNDATPAH